MVALFYYVGFWKSALISYSAHLVPDFLTGGVKLFLPFSAATYGFNFSWWGVGAVCGLFSGLVILTGLLTLRYRLRFSLLKGDRRVKICLITRFFSDRNAGIGIVSKNLLQRLLQRGHVIDPISTTYRGTAGYLGRRFAARTRQTKQNLGFCGRGS